MASFSSDDANRVLLSGFATLERYSGQADFISQAQLSKLRMYAEYDNSQFRDALEVAPNDVSEYLDTLLAVLSNIMEADVVNYLLALVCVVTEAIHHTVHFKTRSNRLGVLSTHMRQNDPLRLRFAATAMARFAGASLTTDAMDTELSSWAVSVLRDTTATAANTAAAFGVLMCALNSPSFRESFNRQNGVPLLVDLVDTASDMQRQYEICFCLWVMSYCEAAAAEYSRHGALTVLCRIVRNSREKVTRVCIAALLNLVQSMGGDYCQEMLDYPNELLTTTASLLERHWSDQDLVDDINTLRDVLHKNYRVLTSFERYVKELARGELAFGPVHTEKFWRDNVERFAAKDFEMIRTLVDVLRSAVLSSPSLAMSKSGEAVSAGAGAPKIEQFRQPISAQVLAIACYDLGEFVRFYPAGRQMSSTLGIKPLVMSLMSHPDKTVQEYALAACTKMMVGNWQAVSEA